MVQQFSNKLTFLKVKEKWIIQEKAATVTSDIINRKQNWTKLTNPMRHSTTEEKKLNI